MSSTTPHKQVDINLRLVIGPETPIEVKLFSRLVERLAERKSAAEQLSAIHKFATDLEEAKQAQRKLRHLEGVGPGCDCPACTAAQILQKIIGPNKDNRMSMLAFARFLLGRIEKGDLEMSLALMGGSDMTVADFSAAGVSQADCDRLLLVVPAGSYERKAPAEAEAPAAAPAAAADSEPPAAAVQEETPAATA